MLHDEVKQLQAASLYDEIRYWVAWLNAFTASDIADAMAVDVTVVGKLLNAAAIHGIIYDTGDRLNGTPVGEEAIWEYVPLPPGPRYHPHRLPEWQVTRGCGELAPVRGMPIRIRSERDMRKVLSTAGAASFHRRREKRYQKQVAAVEARRERDRQKAREAYEDRRARKHKQKELDV